MSPTQYFIRNGTPISKTKIDHDQDIDDKDNFQRSRSVPLTQHEMKQINLARTWCSATNAGEIDEKKVKNCSFIFLKNFATLEPEH
jgi:hypothetical protein